MRWILNVSILFVRVWFSRRSIDCVFVHLSVEHCDMCNTKFVSTWLV